MFETGDALPVLKFEWPQRNSSLQAKDHPKFAQRDALPVRQQINLVVEVIGLVEEAIKALEKRAPAEEEVNLIEAFVTTEFVKDESATSNAVTRLKIYTNAVQWARTVRWFRIVEHLEGDLETSTTDESAKRQVLFQKLDILRPVFQSQLRVAEAGLLEIRGMDDDALWPENSEERNSFQIKGYLHALKVVKLFTILEEIDELGDDDDIDATDLRYADLEREKEVLRGEIKELEDEIGRSEEDEDRRSSSESLQTATEIVSRVM